MKYKQNAEYSEISSAVVKCNDAIVAEKSVQNILKASLFPAREVEDACSISVVTPYLLAAEKKFASIINLSGLHRRYFILFVIVI